jgi:hypothetical protein
MTPAAVEPLAPLTEAAVTVSCHVSADPTALILVMSGRQGPLRPARPPATRW